MKSLIALLLISFTTFSEAQALKPDFICEATSADGTSYEVGISNFDFVQEVEIKKENKACQFTITSGSYSERSVAPTLSILFDAKESCQLSKTVKLLDKGFLKISDIKNKASAHVLMLVGENTLKCVVKHYNKKKLTNRVNSSF